MLLGHNVPCFNEKRFEKLFDNEIAMRNIECFFLAQISKYYGKCL